ncbi:hypothetical protein K438DRAFT_1968576 [Mycena galopus ATCC 62051]|nr:hypothetical protein K438DRAFT_1968576 [Mycena galopus ATCC 62051]
MKTFISASLSALIVVAQAFTHSPRLESALLNRKTETCGDVSDLVPWVEVYIQSITAHIYTPYDNNATNIFTGNPGDYLPRHHSSGLLHCGPFHGALLLLQKQRRERLLLHDEPNGARCRDRERIQMTAEYIYPSQICGNVPLYQLQFISANPDYFYTTSTVDFPP